MAVPVSWCKPAPLHLGREDRLQRVEVVARVAGEDRQPDRVNGELGVRVGVEDVRADPTGPELADASGRRDEQDQPWLAGMRVEQRAQLPDVAQIGEVPRAARGCA